MRYPHLPSGLVAALVLILPSGMKAQEPSPESSFGDCGAIRTWNILGPYEIPNPPGGALPGEDFIPQDFMTDGKVGELSFEWFPGATIDTDFGGCAASLGLADNLTGRNPGGVPTVFAWTDDDGHVDLQDAFGVEIDDTITYTQVYIYAERTMSALLGISTGSTQVNFNCHELWIKNVGRDTEGPCDPSFPLNMTRDGTLIQMIIEKGINTLLIKQFAGNGNRRFAVRIQDEFGFPITKGLTVLHDIRDLDEEAPHCGNRFLRGDADGDGSLLITDAISILFSIFLSDPVLVCEDAADVDDSGSLDVTDVIFVLKHLFLGDPQPPGPFPCCGLDATRDDPLDCEEIPTACS